MFYKLLPVVRWTLRPQPSIKLINFRWNRKFCTIPKPDSATSKIQTQSDIVVNNPIISTVAATTTTTTLPTPLVRNADDERRLQIIKLEVSVLRQEGRKAPDPDLLSDHHWEHLLNLTSKSGRAKYYAFLWKLEKKKENNQAKKEKKRDEVLERKQQQQEENSQNDHIIYSLSRTSIFLRIYDQTINLWHNNKLTRAMQFSQKLILDCSYDDHMIQREAINTAKQLMLCFATNRTHDQPFDLHFCNAQPKATTIKYLEKHIPTMRHPEFPMNIHECSYLDLFPKDRLVYLTPHCKNDLETFDHDAIYIIGAIVDKINNEPLSLGKAKKLGLKMARLPLDRYLQWSSGSGKSLTLNQMIEILLEIRQNGDWTKALNFVPRRKIANEEVEQQKIRKGFEKSLRKTKITFDLSEPLKPSEPKPKAGTKKPSKYLKYL